MENEMEEPVRSTKRRHLGWRFIVVAMLLAMVAAACSSGESSDDPDATTTTQGSGGGSETTTTGGGDGGDDGEFETLTVIVPTEHQTMDPQQHRNRFTQIISRKVHDNLVYLDPSESAATFEWKLATGYTQVDDLTWDIHLREGIEFTDGTPFNSEAVVYTFDRLLDPANNSPRATMGSLNSVVSVEAVDEYTVRWNLSEPIELNSQGFPNTLSIYSQEILKPGYYDGISLEEAYSYPTLGTGPWKFVEWEQGQFIRFEANPDYWDGPPQVDELVFRFVPEASTRAAELIAGNADLVYPVDADTMSALAGAEGIEVQSVEGNSMSMLQMSVQEGRTFADNDLRVGLNHAIDRQTIVDNLFRGLAVVERQMTPANDSTPEDGGGREWDWEGYVYDPDLAAEMLAPLVGTKILLHSSTTDLLVAEVVAEQIRQVGLDVEVVPVEPAAMSAGIDSGEFDLWIQRYGGLEAIENNWDTHFACATNEAGIIRTGYCNPDQDARMEAARELDHEEAEMTVYAEIGKELNAAAPWVPLWTLNEIAAYRDYVKGFVISAIGQMNLWPVYFEK